MLGILIPPSVILIIYSVIVEANIVTMFAAALIPGLIAVALFIFTILVYVTIVPDAGPKAHFPSAGSSSPRPSASCRWRWSSAS